MTFEPGDKLCSCTLLVKCGEGSYGEVWLAENAIGGKVALKILKKKFSEREIRGLQNYKDCSHPNLLKIRHIEINDDFACYTMDAADDLNNGKGDYLPDTLANRLNKYGRLDSKEITAMLDGVLDGLEELHKHGLVHRDIKPDNILYINGRATLSDAGLIAPVGQNTLVGSPGFISPRLMESGGVAETSDDFYALSKVVFCALTGLAPNEYPTIPQEVTISLDPKINRALLAGCNKEIKSSAEFRKAVAGEVVPQPQKKTETKIVTVERVKIPLTLKIILTVLILILAAVVFWMVRSEYRRNEKINHPQVDSVPVVITERSSAPESSGDFTPAVTDEKIPESENIVKVDVPEKSLVDYPQLPKPGNSRMHRITATDVFSHFELYQAKYLPKLLEHRIFSYASISDEIRKAVSGYRPGKAPVDPIFPMSRMMSSVRDTRKAGEVLLKSRQQYWREQSGKPEEIIRKMLTEDPVMQMAAINMLLEKFCRSVLETREYEGKFDQTVWHLVRLQNELQDEFLSERDAEKANLRLQQNEQLRGDK